MPTEKPQDTAEPTGAASELSAGLGVTAPRRKMPPLCYVNMQTLDTAVGFWNSKVPEFYEPVYPEDYVDELLRERNNAELRAWVEEAIGYVEGPMFSPSLAAEGKALLTPNVPK